MTLPAQAQVVVIGGGIIGCSTAYHLAKDHNADVLLIEQGKLTSGSTWHAAGLVGQLRSSASITQVLKRSVELYKTLEAETGLATGWKMTGCLRLATTADRWTEYRRLATTALSFGMDMELISPAEVKRAYARLLKSAKAYRKNATLLGVQVQQMVKGGQEVMVGAVTDPSFGKLIASRATGSSASQSVLPVNVSFRPMPATMSPGLALSSSIRLSPIIR